VCVYMDAVVKVDRRIRWQWHYTTTILRLRIGARGIEIVNFTISLALSAGTLIASAGTPYHLVPAYFYPCMDGKVSMVFNRNSFPQMTDFSRLGALQAVTYTLKVVVSIYQRNCAR